MFGQRPAFGTSSAPGFAAAGSTFGTGTAAPAFGSASAAAAPQSAFGAPSSSLWNNPGTAVAGGGGGGLFGAGATPSTGLFGPTNASVGFGAASSAAPAFGAGTSFGASSAFKPAVGFGGSTAATTGTGGLFGSAAATTTTVQPTSSGGLFGSGGTTAFGATSSPFATAGFGSGGGSVGTTVKFQPPNGTDTMMKSGQQQTINTRHMCITCMKEYENKSIEELRCEDYLANRKGPQAGGAAGGGAAGGLFGSPAAAAVATAQPPTSAVGLFGSSQPASAGGLFGAQKQLFGGGPAASAAGFGGGTTTGAGAFGNPAGSFASTSGGLFGAKPAAAGFGAPQSTSTSGFSFGAPTTSAAAAAGGLFGAQQNKPFGATQPAGGGLFGSAAAPAFGTAAPAAFGATTAGFGQPAAAVQPNQSIGLFGGQQNKPTAFGTAFGSAPAAVNSAAPAFGFGTTTSAAVAPFGQQAAAVRPTFGAFGPATSAAPSAFGTGGFGGGQQQATGGLFGAQNKPSAFGFGGGGVGATIATSQPSFGQGMFGGQTQPAAAAGGMFGTAQQKPGSLFGSSGATVGFGTAGGGVGFGSTAQPGFGGSFGMGGGGGFGGSNPAAFGNALGGQSFQGGIPPAVGPQPPPPSGGIQDYLASLTSNPYGDDPLFKNLIPGGSGGAASAADDSKLAEVLKPTNALAQKAVLANHYKMSSPSFSTNKIKPKSLNSSLGGATNKSGGGGKCSSLFDGLEDDDDDDEANKSGLFVPRCSVKKLVVRPKSPPPPSVAARVNVNVTNDDDDNNSISFPFVKDKNVIDVVVVPVEDSFSALNTKKKTTSPAPPPPSASGPTSPDDVGEADVSASVDPNVTLAIPGRGGNKSDSASSGRDDDDEDPDVGDDDDDDEVKHPAGIVLRRPQYYTVPAMSELASITDDDGNCLVENLTVGRRGYGNIFFPGITNVKNLNLDDVVFFRNKEVIVYPDDAAKPMLGDGLNKRAQVTLDKVWPVDKTKRQPIRCPDKLQELNYERKLQKACLKLGAKFVEYRPETGSWVFKVQHFSKYGLPDDDSDEENSMPNKNNKLQHPQKKMKTTTTTTTTLAARDGNVDGGDKRGPMQKTSLNLSTSDGVVVAAAANDRRSNVINVNDEKVRRMKATLFDSDDEMDCCDDDDDGGDGGDRRAPPNVDVSKLLVAKQPRPVILEQRSESNFLDTTQDGVGRKGLGGGSFSIDFSLLSQPSLPAATATKTPKKLPCYTLQAGYDKYVTLPVSSAVEDQRPKTVVPRHVGKLTPFQESVANSDRLKSLADSGLFASRSFRVGWAGGWTTANPGPEAVDRVVIERQPAVGAEEDSGLESWLEVSWRNSRVVVDQDDVPKFEPEVGTDSLHAHADEAARQEVESVRQVWDLMVALWGKLELNYVDDDDDDGDGRPDGHDVTMRRKEALSSWLESAVDAAVREEVTRARSRGDGDVAAREVLSTMRGGDLEEACDRSQRNGDHYAAMLMSAASGSESRVGQLVLRYLDLLREAGAEKLAGGRERLRAYALTSGAPVWNDDVNAFDGLDWLRSLAVTLRFVCAPVASVGDALASFDDAFRATFAAAPRPAHDVGEEDPAFPVYDIKYHLLKLYSSRCHPLESVVTPTTYTSDRLDHRLGWFVGQVLRSLGHRLRHGRDDQHHRDFASQLEAAGLWHWSVFVLLHLDDPVGRKSAVCDVVGRHVRLDDDVSSERERFVHENLRVPLAWIAEAKAVRAGIDGNFGDQAWYLIKAGEWNAAHRVVVDEIAPDAVIADDCVYLHELLGQLASDAARVADWNNAGGVYFDFLGLDAEVADIRKLLDNDDDDDGQETEVGYRLERLRPRVTSVCARIGSLSSSTAKKRLCQAELAKKVAHLMRVVTSLDSASSSGRGGCSASQTAFLAEHLARLPLPDDYELQELRTLTRMYMKGMIASS